MPAFVVPAVATTANTESGSPSASSAACSVLPVSRSSSVSTISGSTSMIRNAFATDEWVWSLTATRQRGRSGRGRPLRHVACHDEGGEVPGRAPGDEAPTGFGGQPREVGDEPQRLVLRVHRAGALEPRDRLQRRCRHHHVEQQRRLRRRGRDEGEEARAVARDHRGREHLGEDSQHVVGIVALRVQQVAGSRLQLVAVDGVVDRNRSELQPILRVREHGPRHAIGELVVLVHDETVPMVALATGPRRGYELGGEGSLAAPTPSGGGGPCRRRTRGARRPRRASTRARDRAASS